MKKQLFLFLLIISFPLITFTFLNNNNYPITECLNFNQSFSENGKDFNGVSSNNVINIAYDAQEYIGLSNNIWNHNLTGYNITVAVLDTGIFPNHSVFTNDFSNNWSIRLKAFYDESIDNQTLNPFDIHWHGTWVTSILGGNSTNYRGVAPGVNFVILKLFNEDNGELVTTLPILSKAIDWIIENKMKYHIRIASMSFGITPTSLNIEYIKQIEDAIERLTAEGILVIAAAGNHGDNPENDGLGTIDAPASAKSVLAVGGVDYEGVMYYKSGKGPTYDDFIKPDVCAPAINVYGANPDDPPNDFRYGFGTSAATPFVAGLAALLLEKNNDLLPSELKNIISLTSFRTIDPKVIKDNIQGWGIIQGYAALDALKNPILISQNTQIEFSLNENQTVYCIPITLPSNHYFFELIQFNNTEAEMYIFDREPDEYGNPVLVSHTINPFSLNRLNKRMGIYVINLHDYYLVVKLVDQETGKFLIRLVFEYRNIIFVGIFIVNFIGLIYVIKLNFNFRNKMLVRNKG
ncbi:MAG: S8 family serine peptidase [Promethearchaeia archaeon]